MLTRLFAAGSVVLCALTLGGRVAAEERPLTADLIEGKKFRIDGLLNDWSGTPIELTQSKGNTRARVSGMLGYDENNFYVGLEIKDDKLVSDDAAVLTLIFPGRDRGHTDYEIRMVPGKPGKSAGVVRVNGAQAPGSKIVEAPMEGGLTMEVLLPWSLFKPAARVRVGLKAELRYADYGAPGQLRGNVSSGSGPARLLTEPEQALKGNLLDGKDLKRPDRFALGDVAGDSMLEAVAVYGGFLTIVGPHYRDGKEFYFGDLKVPNASHVKRFELRDVDGDGKDDIIMIVRDGKDSYRDILDIRRVGANEAPESVFAHEVAVVTPEGKITNEVEFKPDGKGISIVISQGEAEGFEEESYREPEQANVPNTLRPWDSVSSRTYTWNGSTFEKSKETKQKPRQAKAKKRGTKAAPSGPPAPPPPRAPNPEELLDKVYALYRKDHKVGKDAPRFDFVTDVAGDNQLERVLVHNKDVVVFGPGFRNASAYAYITVGVASPEDIIDVTSHDLTGDGKAEVVARVVLHGKSGKELGDEPVDRYGLFIYRVDEDGIARVFAAETGRSMSGNRVLEAVAFRPAPQGGYTIELLPGRAVGWDKKSYPFPEDAASQGGLEPLVLPWGAPKRTYAFSGGAFAAQ